VGRDLDTRLDQVAALGEPVRRALYRFVSAQPEPVTREQAAAGVGVAPHTAKFHLDRLVVDGLLEAGYRRPPGRGGPGAGRPAKVYRRNIDLDVSFPQRRYDLAGRFLVKAVAQAERTGSPVTSTLHSVATQEGRSAGAQIASSLGRRAPRREVAAAVVSALTTAGYEPRQDGDAITLANCPFHALASEAAELVCGMNHAYLAGVLDGIGATHLDAKLDPARGRCCVRLERR
jgi:predicted ArsR family transcriptional regulator